MLSFDTISRIITEEFKWSIDVWKKNECVCRREKAKDIRLYWYSNINYSRSPEPGILVYCDICRLNSGVPPKESQEFTEQEYFLARIL